MIFWLVFKREISFNILKHFGFSWRIFLKIIFLHPEILEFP